MLDHAPEEVCVHDPPPSSVMSTTLVLLDVRCTATTQLSDDKHDNEVAVKGMEAAVSTRGASQDAPASAVVLSRATPVPLTSRTAQVPSP